MTPDARSKIKTALTKITVDDLQTVTRKEQRLEIRLTELEKQQIQEIADLLGISAAEYLLSLHRHAYPALRPH